MYVRTRRRPFFCLLLPSLFVLFLVHPPFVVILVLIILIINGPFFFSFAHVYDTFAINERTLQGSVREQSYRTNDMREKGPLLVYSHDGRKGGLRPPVHTLWGEFYEVYPRDPTDVSGTPHTSYPVYYVCVFGYPVPGLIVPGIVCVHIWAFWYVLYMCMLYIGVSNVRAPRARACVYVCFHLLTPIDCASRLTDNNIPVNCQHVENQ